MPLPDDYEARADERKKGKATGQEIAEYKRQMKEAVPIWLSGMIEPPGHVPRGPGEYQDTLSTVGVTPAEQGRDLWRAWSEIVPEAVPITGRWIEEKLGTEEPGVYRPITQPSERSSLKGGGLSWLRRAMPGADPSAYEAFKGGPWTEGFPEQMEDAWMFPPDRSDPFSEIAHAQRSRPWEQRAVSDLGVALSDPTVGPKLIGKGLKAAFPPARSALSTVGSAAGRAAGEFATGLKDPLGEQVAKRVIPETFGEAQQVMDPPLLGARPTGEVSAAERMGREVGQWKESVKALSDVRGIGLRSEFPWIHWKGQDDLATFKEKVRAIDLTETTPAISLHSRSVNPNIDGIIQKFAKVLEEGDIATPGARIAAGRSERARRTAELASRQEQAYKESGDISGVRRPTGDPEVRQTTKFFTDSNLFLDNLSDDEVDGLLKFVTWVGQEGDAAAKLTSEMSVLETAGRSPLATYTWELAHLPHERANFVDSLEGLLYDGLIPPPYVIKHYYNVFGVEVGDSLARKAMERSKALGRLGVGAQGEGDFALDVANIPRALWSMGDMGAFMRQAFYVLFPMNKEQGQIARNALKLAVRAFMLGGEKHVQDTMRNIKADPAYQMSLDAGLSIHDLTISAGRRGGAVSRAPEGSDPTVGLTAREEQYISTLATKIPGYGPLVRASERFHATFLNIHRFELFKLMAREYEKVTGVPINYRPAGRSKQELKDEGLLSGTYKAGERSRFLDKNRNPATQDEAAMKSLAGMVNAMTGRGPGFFGIETVNKALSSIFFSFRLATSTPYMAAVVAKELGLAAKNATWGQMRQFVVKTATDLEEIAAIKDPVLRGQRYAELAAKDSYKATRLLMRHLASRSAATVGSVLTILGVTKGIAELFGLDFDVDTDPRSTTFLELQFGQTNIDILKDLGMLGTLTARMIAKESISNQTGQVYEADRGGLLLRALRSKLSPQIGLTSRYMIGRGFLGEDVSFRDELFTPPIGRDPLRLREDSVIGQLVTQLWQRDISAVMNEGGEVTLSKETLEHLDGRYGIDLDELNDVSGFRSLMGKAGEVVLAGTGSFIGTGVSTYLTKDDIVNALERVVGQDFPPYANLPKFLQKIAGEDQARQDEEMGITRTQTPAGKWRIAREDYEVQLAALNARVGFEDESKLKSEFYELQSDYYDRRRNIFNEDDPEDPPTTDKEALRKHYEQKQKSRDIRRKNNNQLQNYVEDLWEMRDDEEYRLAKEHRILTSDGWKELEDKWDEQLPGKTKEGKALPLGQAVRQWYLIEKYTVDIPENLLTLLGSDYMGKYTASRDLRKRYLNKELPAIFYRERK